MSLSIECADLMDKKRVCVATHRNVLEDVYDKRLNIESPDMYPGACVSW